MAADTCCEKCANVTGCCCFMADDDFKSKPLAEVVQNDKRQCTDLPCCLLLIGLIVSQILLIAIAAKKGADPKYLLYGFDYSGKICDGKNGAGGRTAWPNFHKSTDVRICVNNCEETSKNATHFPGMIRKYDSYDFVNSYCIPKVNAQNFDSSAFNSGQETIQRAVGDINIAKWLLLAMSFVAIVTSFIYLKLVACIGRFIVCLTMILVFVGGVMLSAFLFKDAAKNLKEPQTKTMGQIEMGVGIFLVIAIIVVFLMLWFMRRSIGIALEMLNEATYAINDMKSTLFFPCLYSLVSILYLVFWVAVACYIYSVRVKVVKDTPHYSYFQPYGFPQKYVDYEFNKELQGTFIWHLVCLFWFMQIIVYFGFMVLAGSFADWYFSEWDPVADTRKKRGYETAELSNAPIYESCWRVLRFHVGSLTLGAMIITIIRIIRGIVKYIEKKTSAAGNPITKCLFCCVQCCLKCCQCFFDYISKEGFIFCTVYGTAYCYSSFAALKLLLANITRAMMVEAVSNLTEIFGRVAIASLNAGISVLLMTVVPYFKEKLSSVMFPTFVVFVSSYLVASIFMMVLEVAVDTMFLCFLMDETVHGSARFATEKLKSIANRSHKMSVAQGNAPLLSDSKEEKKAADNTISV